jgi:hypothetical protein
MPYSVCVGANEIVGEKVQVHCQDLRSRAFL